MNEAHLLESLLTELNRQAAVYIPKMAVGIAVFVFFWYVSVFVHKLFHKVAVNARPGKRDVLELGGQSAAIGLKILGIVTALGTMNVNVSALVAGLGLTGFALGFALKDAISNLLAGALILFYRPFHRGDVVAVTGLEGEVVETNFRYTALSAGDKTYLIPNSMLLNNAIIVVHMEGKSHGDG